MASKKYPQVRLKIEKTTKHPWIFRKMIIPPRYRLPVGSVVEALSPSGHFIGSGFFHPLRPVAIRLLSQNPRESIDREFFKGRIHAAKTLRESILGLPSQTDSCRIVHGEADGLSGLVIDKYANLLVIEPFSAGYIPFCHDLVSILQEVYPDCRVCFRPDARTEEQEGVSFTELRKRYPCPQEAIIHEYSLTMVVSLTKGHKTGYFIDQRENRRFVHGMAANKEVWDLFCYTGGFGISASLGKAKSVLGVDLDEKALETARKNADLNRVSVQFIHEDCFNFLRRMEKDNQQADLIIVDPAKLAGVRDEIPRAVKTYNDINRLAIGRVRTGGVLLSCSCSGLVGEEQFLSILGNAAREAKAELQIFRVAGAADDHPYRTDFLEGRYLKAVFSRVLRFS